MELMCPHCHSNNHVGPVEATDSARFDCASCRLQFEAMLVEGALVPVLPREADAPFAPPSAEDLFDILSIPQEPHAETAAAPAQVLEDVFVMPAEFADAAPPAEVDPFHITESAATSHAPLTAAEDAPPAVAEDAPAVMEEEAAAPVAPPRVVARPVIPAPRPAAAVAAARPAPAGPAVDKYAVGMRVLRISPMWLLLSSVGFFGVLLTMSWLSKPIVPVGEAVAQLPNQATSRAAQATAVEQVEQAKAAAEKALPQKPRASAEAPAENAAPPVQTQSAQIQPAQTQPAAAPAPPAAARGNFTVQVGSFNNQSEANEHVSRLRGAGVEARSVAAELPGRGTWYRVQAGRFETRDEAAKAGAQLRARGLAAAALVAEMTGR